MSSLRRLFSVEPLKETGDVVRLDSRESHHGRHVLRLQVGARVAVFDEAGRQFVATVERVENRWLVVLLGEPLAAAAELPIPLVLYLALAKGAAFESVLQRSVELGVAAIVPFASERSVVRIGRGSALERKLDRWRQILLDATKQCGRARLTTIEPPAVFEYVVGSSPAGTLCFCCVADSTASRFGGTLRTIDLASADRVAVMIGPEGGLTPGEIALARDNGWRLVSLGSRTLRVETAATAALALLLEAFNEM